MCAKNFLLEVFWRYLFFKKATINKGRTPDEGSPSFFARQRNSPSPAFIERYGNFALCGGRQGLRALDLRRLLKKAGENFYTLVCANIAVERTMCAKNFPLEVFWRYLFFKKGSKI